MREDKFNITKSICEYIEELEEDLKDPFKKKILSENYGMKYNTSKTDNHRLITKILKDQKVKSVSDTTVYRLLYVKKKSRVLYEKIKKEELTIKEAYETLRPAKKKDLKIETTEEEKYSLNSMKDVNETIIAIADFFKKYDFDEDDEDLIINIDKRTWEIRMAIKKCLSKRRIEQDFI